MTETGETAMDKVKNLFHEDIKARVEVQGGTWDAKANTYTITDETNGVRTVYALKKNTRLETGYAVRSHSYKDVADVNGKMKSVEVSFDVKRNMWLEKTSAAKAVSAITATRPVYMGVLNEQKVPGQAEPIRTLVIEPAKFRQVTRIIPMKV